MPAPPYDPNTISDANIAHRRGVTLNQGRVWRDNPISMVQFGDGAPVNEAAWHPYDMVTVGDGSDGVFFDGAADGAVASVVTPDFADGFEYKIILDNIANPVTTLQTVLRLEKYLETSAAYGAAQDVSISTTAAISNDVVQNFGELTLIAPRVDRNIHSVICDVGYRSSDTGSVAMLTAGRATYSGTAQKVLRARLSYSVGNIAGQGTMRLYRRRDLLST